MSTWAPSILIAPQCRQTTRVPPPRPLRAVAAVLLAAVAPLLASGSAGAGLSAPPTRAVIAAAADAAVAAGLPGVSIYVRHGAEVTVLTRGYADVAAKRPMTSGDRF